MPDHTDRRDVRGKLARGNTGSKSIARLLVKDGFCRAVLDAIPSPVLIIEKDARIVGFNAVVGKLLGKESEFLIGGRAGNIFRCRHSADSTDGCGFGRICMDCIIRNSVEASPDGGEPVSQKLRMEFFSNDESTDTTFFVTTVPLNYDGKQYALILLEDIMTPADAVRQILAMCANCKKIHNDHRDWHSLEDYFKAFMGVDFTHTICPECSEKLYPMINLRDTDDGLHPPECGRER